jgi:ribosomal protein S6
LAYEIKGKRSGVYYLYRYTGEGDIPAKLYRTIKMTPSILRHLTVVRDPSVRTFADLARQKAEDEQRRASESEESAGHKKAVADRDEHSSEQGEQNA